ncbi:MAG TPA: BamA/TamA family outer membrane protein [Gemmatimonadales bacterium]|nr:BamA/TamA family outer membrane protein [Gemmatimonadales bacterium]
MPHSFVRAAGAATLRVALATALVAVGLAPAAPLHAQDTTAVDPTLTDADLPWALSYFPYITGLSNDGPLVAGRVRYWKPAAYEDQVTYKAALQLDAGIGFRGSRFAIAHATVPRVAPGWRLNLLGAAVREARFGFYGLGNETVFNEANTQPDNPLYYRVRRRVYRLNVEATRRIVGPLHFAVLGELASTRYSAPEDQPSLFGQTIGPRLDEDDASMRGALVLDTRDNEYNTTRGLLLEGGAQVATGGGNYERVYGILRGWVTPRTGTTLAVRLAGSEIYGNPTLDAHFLIPGWERPVLVLGGNYSHRGLDLPRFAGRSVLFGNFEVRQEVFGFGDLGAIGLLGFIDAGRVFEGEEFRLTFDDLKVGGGGGLALRILRSTIFTLTIGRGPEGTNIDLNSGWFF